jgi:hypothetical protein
MRVETLEFEQTCFWNDTSPFIGGAKGQDDLIGLADLTHEFLLKKGVWHHWNVPCIRLGSASPRSTRSGPRTAGNGARDRDLKSIGVLLLGIDSSDGGLVPGIHLHTTCKSPIPS